jgi:hypothetical protein
MLFHAWNLFLLFDTGMACSFNYMKWTLPAFVYACPLGFFRIDLFSLCSDTVMGWSFYYMNFTSFCLRMHIYAFCLCSDTVMGWSFYYMKNKHICLHMCISFFTHEIFFPLLRYSDGLELLLHKLGVFTLYFFPFLRMKSFSLCSDTVMGWSFYYINFTCICLHMRIRSFCSVRYGLVQLYSFSLFLRMKYFPLCSDTVLVGSFYNINFTCFCLRMRTVAFFLCSDTVMGLSWCYADWTRICLHMRIMLFYAWNLFLSAQILWWTGAGATGLNPHLFAHARDAFYAWNLFLLAQILWWAGAFII